MEKEELEKRLNWYENKYGPYIEKEGLHNWRNLFRKPNIYEIIIFMMLVLSLFMYWAYYHDVRASYINGYNTCLYKFDPQNPIFSENPQFLEILNITIERGNNYEKGS